MVPPTNTATVSRRRSRSGARDRTIQKVQEFKRRQWKKVAGCHRQPRVKDALFGFWIHRALVTRAIANVVIDAASIEVNRRQRRAKTDRLDARKLVTQLVRHHSGKRVWSVVCVPAEADEAARHLHRDLDVLKSELRAHRTRIQSLLFTHGIDPKAGRTFLTTLPTLRQWDGQPVPASLQARVVREYQRRQTVDQRIRALEHERKTLSATARTKSVEQATVWAERCGIGPTSGWVFAMVFFGWRQFANRLEVAAAAGLTPTPLCASPSSTTSCAT